MKVLGKRSLSSAINIFLMILLICCIGCLTYGIFYISMNWNKLMEINVHLLLCGVYLSGIISLIMIIEFMGIFQSLKKEKIFDNENIKRLKISYISSIIIGILYVIISCVIINTGLGKIEINYYILSFFAIIIAMVFLIFGVGLIVLTEIYKKAILYKEENELTI